jgi:hypothetical protein
MPAYRFSIPANVLLEVVADDEASARALAARETESYPETDLDEGELDGSGRVTILTVTMTGDATLT